MFNDASNLFPKLLLKYLKNLLREKMLFLGFVKYLRFAANVLFNRNVSFQCFGRDLYTMTCLTLELHSTPIQESAFDKAFRLTPDKYD